MKSWITLIIGALLLLTGSSLAQEKETEALSLRVTFTRPGGLVVVDRGSRDGVQLRDRVVLHPRGGKPQPGFISVVNERDAEVRLSDPKAQIPLGCQGLVHVLKVEQEVVPEPPPVEPEAEGTQAGQGEGGETVPPPHPPWTEDDAEFQQGMPLLQLTDGVRPEDRQPLVSGRLYTIADFRVTSNDRSDSFVRVGADVHYENLFGRGGELVFEGETNYRHTDVKDQVDESTTHLRIDRLSYAWGGTRFEPTRHEFGRFLHHGVPELGILDGYEWSQRLDSGGRVGASGGYLPELSPTMSTGRDLSASIFYQWAADQREELTTTAAYQKTWHDGDADRDLFVGKVNYWPGEGWDFHGTAWIDYYTTGDQSKGSGPQLTRVFASSGKTWDSGDGVNLSFTHDRFPETDRDEFDTLLSQQIADDHDERLAASTWTWLESDRRLNGQVGLWVDQDDSGGDLDLSLDQYGLGTENGRGSAGLFAVSGKFSTIYGTRLSYGIEAVSSRWNVSYEFALSDQVGFSSNNDTIEQHRILASHDYQSTSGWSISLHAGADLWTEEKSVNAGVYIQRSF